MTFSSWCIHGSACRAGGRFLLGRFRLDVWWYGVPLLLRGAVIDSIGCWDWQGGCINVRDGQWSRGIVVVYITFLRRNKVENPPSQQKTRLPRHPCPVWLYEGMQHIATLRREPRSLDNTSNGLSLVVSSHIIKLPHHRGWVVFLRHPAAREPQQQRRSMSWATVESCTFFRKAEMCIAT